MMLFYLYPPDQTKVTTPLRKPKIIQNKFPNNELLGRVLKQPSHISSVLRAGIIAERSRALVQNQSEWTVPSLNPGKG